MKRVYIFKFTLRKYSNKKTWKFFNFKIAGKWEYFRIIFYYFLNFLPYNFWKRINFSKIHSNFKNWHKKIICRKNCQITATYEMIISISSFFLATLPNFRLNFPTHNFYPTFVVGEEKRVGMPSGNIKTHISKHD